MAGSDAQVTARGYRNLRRQDLGRHAAGTDVRGGASRHRFDIRGDLPHLLDELRVRILVRIRGEQSFDIGQQHHAVRTRHLRNPGGQAIVVAVADLGGCHGVVLVNHRKRPQREQGFQSGACVEITPAALAVLQSEQHLRHRHVAALEQVLVRMREPYLAHGSGRLALLEPQRSLGQPQLAAPERNGAGGNQDQLLAALAQPQQVFDERLEPGAIDPPALRIHQQRRAHLHDDAPCLHEGRCGIRTSGAHGGKTIRNRAWQGDCRRLL